MAGKHTGGSNTMGVFNEANAGGSAAPFPEHFMPKNDKAYAEGRLAASAGEAQNTNPHGATIQAAQLINQIEAFLCWDNGWFVYDAEIAGFQLETAVVDGAGFT